MNRKPTRTERAIAKRLNVTTSALDALVRAAARPDGQTTGPRTGYGARPAILALYKHRPELLDKQEQGYWYEYFLTDAGRALVAEARRLGW